MNITKINDYTHKITTPYKDIFTTVCTIRTDAGVLLFDAASFDEDVEGYILPMLKELGISTDDVKYIFISHNHKDHAGALRKLLEFIPKATVLSRSDALKEAYPDFDVVSPCDGDEIMNVLKVVTIPGHTDDSMAVLDTRTNTLITGDCLQVYGIFGSQDWGANIGFPTEHLEAVEKVRKMNVQNIYTAHDYHPVGACACGSKEVSRLLDACVEPIMKIKKLILENPSKDDAEIRLMYNSSDDIPPITTRLVEATRKALAEGKMSAEIYKSDESKDLQSDESTSLFAKDKIWSQMYEAAKNVIGEKQVSEYVICGQVAAAVLSKSGKIYTGVCVDTCSTLGVCAERNAIFNMLTNGDYEIDKVLCIMPDGSNGAPCGACRELMVQIMAGKYRDIEIMLDYSEGRTAKLGDLTPEWWIK